MSEDYRYYYDDWSNSPPSSLLRHNILTGYTQLNARIREDYYDIRCHWLEENIGERGKNWHCTESQATFYFKYKEDAMAFMLAWL